MLRSERKKSARWPARIDGPHQARSIRSTRAPGHRGRWPGGCRHRCWSWPRRSSRPRSSGVGVGLLAHLVIALRAPGGEDRAFAGVDGAGPSCHHGCCPGAQLTLRSPRHQSRVARTAASRGTSARPDPVARATTERRRPPRSTPSIDRTRGPRRWGTHLQRREPPLPGVREQELSGYSEGGATGLPVVWSTLLWFSASTSCRASWNRWPWG